MWHMQLPSKNYSHKKSYLLNDSNKNLEHNNNNNNNNNSMRRYTQVS
jgi:hypothetical protein